MPSLAYILVPAATVALLCASGIGAQQQDQGQNSTPIPAYHSPLTGAIDNTDLDKSTGQEPAQQPPLSSVQGFSLEPESRRSYWQPHADFAGTADSNAFETPNGRDWRTWISVSGGVDIHRVSGNSVMTVGYTSGGMLTNDPAAGNGVVQELNFVDKFLFHHSVLSFYDQASYLPESAQGFGGLGAAGVGGGQSAPGLAFSPGQTVLTGRGQMLNNSNAIEFDQYLSSRASLTFSGGYSLLHYFDANDLFDYGVVNGRAGYNYQIGERDSIGVIYTFSDFRYTEQSLVDHTMQLSYGREITGKLAFQIAAGPQVFISDGTTTQTGGEGTGTAVPPGTKYLWSLNTSLQYQQRRYGLGITYNHGIGGGSGVLIGAKTDTVTGSLNRQMSRTFASGFSGGYSRSEGVGGAGAANQLYDYWFGGVNFTQPLSETIGLTLSYQIQYQTSNGIVCVGPTCGGNVLRNMISIGLGWHERPLLF